MKYVAPKKESRTVLNHVNSWNILLGYRMTRWHSKTGSLEFQKIYFEGSLKEGQILRWRGLVMKPPVSHLRKHKLRSHNWAQDKYTRVQTPTPASD